MISMSWTPKFYIYIHVCVCVYTYIYTYVFIYRPINVMQLHLILKVLM